MTFVPRGDALGIEACEDTAGVEEDSSLEIVGGILGHAVDQLDDGIGPVSLRIAHDAKSEPAAPPGDRDGRYVLGCPNSVATLHPAVDHVRAEEIPKILFVDLDRLARSKCRSAIVVAPGVHGLLHQRGSPMGRPVGGRRKGAGAVESRPGQHPQPNVTGAKAHPVLFDFGDHGGHVFRAQGAEEAREQVLPFQIIVLDQPCAQGVEAFSRMRRLRAVRTAEPEPSRQHCGHKPPQLH